MQLPALCHRGYRDRVLPLPLMRFPSPNPFVMLPIQIIPEALLLDETIFMRSLSNTCSILPNQAKGEIWWQKSPSLYRPWKESFARNCTVQSGCCPLCGLLFHDTQNGISVKIIICSLLTAKLSTIHFRYTMYPGLIRAASLEALQYTLLLIVASLTHTKPLSKGAELNRYSSPLVMFQQCLS